MQAGRPSTGPCGTALQSGARVTLEGAKAFPGNCLVPNKRLKNETHGKDYALRRCAAFSILPGFFFFPLF